VQRFSSSAVTRASIFVMAPSDLSTHSPVKIVRPRE
jgi:hypothetical protein